jgi:DNA-directed RNA polymerase specialized sigma24 family protein
MCYLIRFFKKIEEAISPERFGAFYQRLRRKYPSIAPYISSGDLLSRLHNSERPDYKINDSILTALISEYQLDRCREKIGSFMLVLFRPGLIRLYYDFMKRVGQFSFISYADLWSHIVIRFFEELKILDLARDRVKIASKVLGRVKNHLRDYFRARFRTLTAERDLIDASDRFFRSEPESDPRDAVEFLNATAEAGIISQTDKHILLATRIYGKSMKELSGELDGMSYDSIRQRKSRCEKIIREHLMKKAEQPA